MKIDGEKFTEQAALYAVGALDNAEQREFEEYLRSALDEEKRELQELTEAASMLPLALPHAFVPPQIKSHLFARIEAQATTAETKIIPLPAKVLPFPEKRRFSFFDLFKLQPVSGLLAAASLLLAITSGLLLWQNSKLSRERDELVQQVSTKNKELAAKDQQVDELAQQTTRLISLAGKEAPQASAKVFWDTAKRKWVIYIYNLPAAPADKDYQLWYITNDQQKVSATIFRPDTNGRRELTIEVPQNVASRLAATAVTLEPKGGSSQPTSGLYLVGTIGA